MIKTFTQEELIRYIYNESTAALTKQIEQAISCDEELAQQCRELQQTKSLAGQLRLQPEERTVNAILNYARTFEKIRS